MRPVKSTLPLKQERVLCCAKFTFKYKMLNIKEVFLRAQISNPDLRISITLGFPKISDEIQ